jgi:putative spermidine/putrescine transport system permease protein
MALPKYTEPRYRIWHYTYLLICTSVFIFLIAPLFVILPLSFNAEQYIHFSDGMLALDPDAFSLRWYEDMVYGTKNPMGNSRLEIVFRLHFLLQLVLLL